MVEPKTTKPRLIDQVKRAAAKSSIEKLKASGRVPTAREMELIEEVDAESAAGQSDAALVADSRILGAVLGVSHATIYKWVRLGMPQLTRGQFDVVRCSRWWRENIATPDQDDETLTAAKRRYWQEKVVNLEIRNAALRGDYVTQRAVVEAAAGIVAIFRNAARSWRTRLPPVLAGRSQDEMLPLIETEIDAALVELAGAMGNLGKEGSCRKRNPKQPRQPRSSSKPSRSSRSSRTRKTRSATKPAKSRPSPAASESSVSARRF